MAEDVASPVGHLALPLNVSSPFAVDESTNYSSGFYDEAASDTAVIGTDIQRHADQLQCQLFQFVLNTLAIGTLCVFGIAGNLLSMVILHRDRHNRVAVFLLQSLAVADSSVLATAFVVLSVFYGLLPLMGHAHVVVNASPIFMQVIVCVMY
jgi:hypothetical protein